MIAGQRFRDADQMLHRCITREETRLHFSIASSLRGRKQQERKRSLLEIKNETYDSE